MNNTIKVTGKGSIASPPDSIQVTIELETLDLDYERSLEYSEELLEKIRIVLKDIGFERQDIKTSYFNIDTKYNSYRDNNDKYIKEFIGYRVENTLRIVFKRDTQRLGQVLKAIAKSGIELEISIRFLLLNDNDLKNRLLEQAIKDSKEKANIMAEAAGVSLGQVRHIDYSWGELEVYGMDLDYSSNIINENKILDIEPEDIQNSETVTVIWGIE